MSSLVKSRLRKLKQFDRYSSPWSVLHRFRVLTWTIVWTLFFRPTPKHLYPWRLLLLRIFGADISGQPYVDASAKIKVPWNLVMEDRSCLGPNSIAYNLDKLVLKSNCTISQEAYLCGGTHDFSDPATPLLIGPIIVGSNAFVGARAFVFPGVVIGDHSLIGACSVVTKDVPPWAVVAGNPASQIGVRKTAS